MGSVLFLAQWSCAHGHRSRRHGTGLARRTSWASAFTSGPWGDLVWPGCPAHPPVCASFPGEVSFQGWASPAHVAGEGLCGVLVPAPCCAGSSGVLGLKKQ